MNQITELSNILLEGLFVVAIIATLLGAFIVSFKSRDLLAVLTFAGLFLLYGLLSGYIHSAGMPQIAAVLLAISTGLSVGGSFKTWKWFFQELPILFR
ncbi:hypothetical protein [Laspinema sp. D2d]|uniref:hypothetical protein n=1 Tax=Laspinema sp. D2d TaxID=2953686 RepID=UPI0021BA52AC|nr:hypothetical protein [Laspinema sp. D2d]